MTHSNTGPAVWRNNRFVKLTESATGTHYRPGNEFAILRNGDEIFPAMLEAIQQAQHHIEFLTYVFWRSKVADQFADALCERSRAGVKVRLLVDAVGGASIGLRTIWQLERAGVQVGWFRPGRWQHLRKLNNRTHRKILIVDGRIGFTGGVGIADVWLGNGQDRHHWRETHCRIEGPACTDMHGGFADSWLEATGEQLVPPPPAPDCGSVAIHTTVSTAGRRPTEIEKLFTAVIPAARQRLWITSGYFIPSIAMVQVLTASARRGVDVRVLTTGNLTDHHVALLAGRATYQELLEAGVKIYEYQKSMHHAKIITIDSAWATIGSTNLDDRSLVLNDELNVSVVDPSVIGALDLQFLEDLKYSKHIRSTRWPQRGLANRIAEAGSSLFRGQL